MVHLDKARGSFIDIAAPPTRPLEATVFVAASNARTEVKAMADYVATGVNDDVTIENAINALPASGGKVKLSEGTFTLGSSIDILKSNVVLEGCGPGTKLFLANGANTSVIVVGNGATALSNIKICNLSIDGNRANQTATSHGIYFYGGSVYLITNSVIENVWVKNCYARGIYLWYSNNNTIIGNNCQSNGSYGIYLLSSNNNTIIGNVLKDNSQDLNNSYDDVCINGSGNIVSNNICLATASNKTRYAVNEVGGDYNIITNNYCSGQVTGKIKLVGLNSIAIVNIEV